MKESYSARVRNFSNLIYTFYSKLKSNALIQDSLISLVGNLAGKGLALLAGILVARFLGKESFGEYGVIRNTILTIGIFSTFGLGYTATKFIADFKTSKPEKLKIFIKYANTITLLFSGVMGVLLYIFADKVAIDILKIKDLGYALRFLAILIVFNAITTTQIGMLAGFGKFKELAQINAVVGVLTFLLTVVLTYYYKFEGALLALVLVQALNCVFNFFMVKKALPKNVSYDISDKNLFYNIVDFSFPIALQECTYALTSWLSTVLLIRLASVGDFGIYSAAIQWNAIILFVPGILRNVVLSHLSSNLDNISNHKSILKRTVKINFIATLVPCLVVVVLSPLIARSYGQTFEGLAGLLAFVVFSTIFTSVSNVYAQAFTSLSKNWLMFFIRFLRDFLIIVLFILLVKLLKLNGAWSLAYSNMLLNVLFLVLMIFIYKKINNVKFN